MYEDISIYLPASYWPLGLANVQDVLDIRRRVMGDIDARIDADERSLHTIRVMDSVWERTLDVSEMIERQPDASTAAVFQCLARRPDARRTFRTGIVEMSLGRSSCRMAAVLELMSGHGRRADRWWLAHRLVGGEGGGASPSRWKEAEGRGAASLEPPFRAWIDADIDDKWARWIHDALGFSEPPRTQATSQDMEGGLPQNARKLAESVAELVRADPFLLPTDPIRLIVFRAGAVETWNFVTSTLCTMDEFIRSITCLGPTDGVALVYPEWCKDRSGRKQEYVLIAAEFKGQRWDGMWSVQRRDGRTVAMELVDHCPRGAVGKHGWIDVAPIDRHPIPLPSRTP